MHYSIKKPLINKKSTFVVIVITLIEIICIIRRVISITINIMADLIVVEIVLMARLTQGTNAETHSK